MRGVGVFFFSPVFLLNYTYPFTPFRQRPRLWLAVKKKKNNTALVKMGSGLSWGAYTTTSEKKLLGVGGYTVN